MAKSKRRYIGNDGDRWDKRKDNREFRHKVRQKLRSFELPNVVDTSVYKHNYKNHDEIPEPV